MCMSCNNEKITKKKIIIFSLIGVAVVATTYFVYTATKSGAVFALPAVLGLAACPLMCVAMGGIMWLGARFGLKKDKKEKPQKFKADQHSCCAKHSNEHHKDFNN